LSYITAKDVEIRLTGKVRFTDDPNESDKMQRTLLKRLIQEAEGRIERLLARRYAAPFRGTNDETFDTLPSTTRETIRTMCELQAVIRVLGNDFGAGTVNDGSKYKAEQEKLLKELVDTEMAQRQEGSAGQWTNPPMDGLKTSLVNATDDGRHGTAINTNPSREHAIADHLTDPSMNWENGFIR
jgi:hypothetical protein